MADDDGVPLHDGNPRPTVVQPVLAGVDVEDVEPHAPYATDRDAVRIPIHMPYTHTHFVHWNALQRASEHRLRRSGSMPELVHAPDASVDVSRRRDVPNDTIGWSYVQSKDEKAGARLGDDDITRYRGEQDAWNEPWAFKNALGIDSNAHVVGNTLVGSGVQSSGYHVSWHQKLVFFLLRNAFVPLFLRLINLVILGATLGVGARLRMILARDDLEYAVGVSPITSIIFACLSIAYAMFQVYLEYKSRPIGLWKASAKLWYMALELIFVCLWSAELALSFDNYFTSAIGCMRSTSPFYSHADPTMPSNISNKGSICDLQVSLICLNFVSVMVYLVVFLVSLFRIFYRVMLQM